MNFVASSRSLRLGCLLALVLVVGCSPARARVVADLKVPPGAPTVGESGAGSFDRGIAAAALGSVDVQGCKGPDGQSGNGHIVTLFLPDGTVADAALDDELLEELNPFIGTPTGDCIVQRFKALRVKPFEGKPVRVGKSVHIR
jgi:hypothetical protein